MATLPDSPSKLGELEQRLGSKWQAIRRAQEQTLARRGELLARFDALGSPDTSLVVFGSVARGEVTSGSDLDWILLVDGQAVPEHRDQEAKIAGVLERTGWAAPGRSGVFGRMVGSHDLVHNIGGEDDLNSNTTRRVLLLLESYAVGNAEAYERVRRQIIRRYLNDDLGLQHAGAQTRIPRFLLNDLTRYWRTVTVDFVYKQRADGQAKWALRNAKLRMSRKLVFAAGLLHVFFCHLDGTAETARRALLEARDIGPMTEYLARRFAVAPLEVLAHACLDLRVSPAVAHAVFDNYDRFLAILDDGTKREALAAAQGHEDLRRSTVWDEIREISHPFHSALVDLFLDASTPLGELTRTYGLF